MRSDSSYRANYLYDPSGNRIRKLTYRNNELTAVISEYNAKNQLVKTTEGESVTQFTYSYRGSLVTEGNTNRSYDCRDKQLSYRDADNVTTQYTYYIDGLRKSKKIGTGETKYFIWSNGNMVYEFTATADTAYFFGLHLVSSDDYKYVLNAHGDVVALVNASGTITKRYEYDAFGVELNPDETDTNPYRYCAEYFDIESGTIYLRARYYSPNHGRFTQLDPARDGLNWYAYCANNPIMFVDPWGLLIELVGTGDEVQVIWQTIKDMSHDALVLTQKTDADGNLIDVYKITIEEERDGSCVNGTELVRRLVKAIKLVQLVLPQKRLIMRKM